jgi:hypothetical protein
MVRLPRGSEFRGCSPGRDSPLYQATTPGALSPSGRLESWERFVADEHGDFHDRQLRCHRAYGIDKALRHVSPAEAASFFRSCGYSVP